MLSTPPPPRAPPPCRETLEAAAGPTEGPRRGPGCPGEAEGEAWGSSAVGAARGSAYSLHVLILGRELQHPGQGQPPPAWGGQSGGRAVSQGKPSLGPRCTGGPVGLCRPHDLRLGPSAHLCKRPGARAREGPGRGPSGSQPPHLWGLAESLDPQAWKPSPHLRGLAGLLLWAPRTPKTGPPRSQGPHPLSGISWTRLGIR